MSHYLFIQSQDPFTEVRTGAQFTLVEQLASAGHQVQLLLVQNGVTSARRGAQSEHFDRLAAHGVTLLADDFSLAQREIDAEQLKPDVHIASVDAAIDALLAGHKVIWN